VQLGWMAKLEVNDSTLGAEQTSGLLGAFSIDLMLLKYSFSFFKSCICFVA
jgi:hypothetical protein